MIVKEKGLSKLKGTATLEVGSKTQQQKRPNLRHISRAPINSVDKNIFKCASA